MALALNQRNLVLGGALLLTLWATYWVSQQENSDEVIDVAEPVRREKLNDTKPNNTNLNTEQTTISAKSEKMADTTESTGGTSWAGGKSWESYQRHASQHHLGEVKSTGLFAPHSWYVPPPPPKVKPVVLAPPPPPKPVAPPAPFTYVGKLENAPSGTQYFLTSNNRVYTVQKGQNIDANWRLDGEDPNAMRLTHLPTGLVQTFSKSNNSAATR